MGLGKSMGSIKQWQHQNMGDNERVGERRRELKGGPGLERKWEIRKERKLGTALGSRGFIILCSTQSNIGPLNRVVLANHPGGFLSRFLPLFPPVFSLSLCLFFLRCMSAIHLSAVSASERCTELSLHVSLGLGGHSFTVSLWQLKSATIKTQELNDTQVLWSWLINLVSVIHVW